MPAFVSLPDRPSAGSILTNAFMSAALEGGLASGSVSARLVAQAACMVMVVRTAREALLPDCLSENISLNHRHF